AVAAVDRPVAAALALREAVPRAVRRRAGGRRDEQRGPDDGSGERGAGDDAPGIARLAMTTAVAGHVGLRALRDPAVRSGPVGSRWTRADPVPRSFGATGSRDHRT